MTNDHYADLLMAISQQIEALREGQIAEGLRYAQVLKVSANVEMLLAWTTDDRPHTRDRRQGMNPKTS